MRIKKHESTTLEIKLDFCGKFKDQIKVYPRTRHEGNEVLGLECNHLKP
jgi:hypothetical protein